MSKIFSNANVGQWLAEYLVTIFVYKETQLPAPALALRTTKAEQAKICGAVLMRYDACGTRAYYLKGLY
jgi:hypothetical protein